MYQNIYILIFRLFTDCFYSPAFSGVYPPTWKSGLINDFLVSVQAWILTPSPYSVIVTFFNYHRTQGTSKCKSGLLIVFMFNTSSQCLPLYM